MPITITQSRFLTNGENKTRLIQAFTNNLTQAGKTEMNMQTVMKQYGSSDIVYL